MIDWASQVGQAMGDWLISHLREKTSGVSSAGIIDTMLKLSFEVRHSLAKKVESWTVFSSVCVCSLLHSAHQTGGHFDLQMYYPTEIGIPPL